MPTGKIGTLTLVLGLDADNATTTGASLAAATAEKSAPVQIKRIDVLVMYMF